MNKNKIKLIPLLLILTLVASSCSFQKARVASDAIESGRGLANTNLDVIIDEFKGYYDSNLSPARKSEIVCPKPQIPPTTIELQRLRRSVTMVETAAR